MIETLYSLDLLDSTLAMLISIIIGTLFGIALEKAGFGSSRRLSGIFYFRDMAVLKVMFTALITTMLGIILAQKLGIVESDNLYLMSTIYGAQVVGGLIFGIGFVMGGWCPGTAAVGMASGKFDAITFLAGTIVGSIIFNEAFAIVKPLYNAGNKGVIFVYDSLHMSQGWFAFLFTIMGIAAFWLVEKIEKNVNGKSDYLNTQFLKTFSFVLFIVAFSILLISGKQDQIETTKTTVSPDETLATLSEKEILKYVEQAQDHIEPEELAERLVNADPNLILVDVRSQQEYVRFHIKNAINIQLQDLSDALIQYKNKGLIVLYSNGMTHPAQARDSLFRQGFNNVYFLTDGLEGFINRCLKPVSLRSEPAPAYIADKINSWRYFFLSENPDEYTFSYLEPPFNTPGLIDSNWLLENLKKGGLKILDLRTQIEYNTSHIPGSISISPESFRGVVNGVPSVLLPASMLAQILSLIGITPEDFIILVYGDKTHDATLVSMVFERLGHKKYGILDGGYIKWKKENKPTDTKLPFVLISSYPLNDMDDFTVDYRTVLSAVNDGVTKIIDVRPEEYYLGKKSDEARAGHIPGAVNRPFSEDINKIDDYIMLKPLDELEKIYASIIDNKDTKVIVHCRTGHQGSQTFFVLKNLLGYKNIYWYDAGWTEWSARSELPIE